MIGDLFQTFDSPRPNQSGLDQKTPWNAEGAPWFTTMEMFFWSAPSGRWRSRYDGRGRRRGVCQGQRALRWADLAWRVWGKVTRAQDNQHA
jgi:hypothetical protein